MRYSLLCTCLFLVWWASGGRGLATPSPSTPVFSGSPGSSGSLGSSGSPGTPGSTGWKTPLPTRNVNFTEMIIKNPSLKINLGNSTNYTLNWTDVVKVIPEALIQKMWEESNVTESLWFSLHKYRDIWKNDDVFKNFTGRPTDYVCKLGKNEQLYNLSRVNPTNIPNYMGYFGIQAPIIQKELFSGINNVLEPKHATHDVFYTTRDYNAYLYVSFGDQDAEMMGYVTKDFSYVTTVAKANGTSKFLTVMMGYTRNLPVLKGNLIYKTDFIMAQNENFSMVVITTFDDYNYFAGVVKPDFQRVFEELTQLSPTKVIEQLENKMVELEATKRCPVPFLTPDTFEYMLKFAFSHFMVAAGLRDSGGYVNANCFVGFMHELNLLRFMTAACFQKFYFNGFTSFYLSTVAGAMITRTPIPALSALSHNLRDDMLAALQLADNIEEMTNRILWAAAEIVDGIYTAYTYTFSLQPPDRRHLLDVYLLLKDKERQHQVLNNNNLMLIYLMSMSMCNSVEISAVTSMLSDGRHYNLAQTFSPCLMSLRYDFTHDKLVSESRLLTNMTYIQARDGALGFFNILRERHVSTFSLLPVSKCLKNYAKNILMVIPMFNVTYVVSTVTISNAMNYDVRDTFIEKKMFVSAVMSNCTEFPGGSGTRQIPIVYNITRSRSECPLCGAAFLGYDERDGLESVMYVTNRKVERNIFSDASPFFDNQNLHTHYLMLFKNGTVIEIRGRYRERTAQFIIITLFILTLMFGAFLAFKIFVYCC
ncbi:envelope glycoprotein H [Equid gammaherpesvirus 2]|nr:envelope glycoprotein H [Equid gammaherpesvirus 2]